MTFFHSVFSLQLLRLAWTRCILRIVYFLKGTRITFSDITGTSCYICFMPSKHCVSNWWRFTARTLCFLIKLCPHLGLEKWVAAACHVTLTQPDYHPTFNWSYITKNKTCLTIFQLLWVIKQHSVVLGGWWGVVFFFCCSTLLEAHGPRLCLQTERNSLNLLASMLIHVKLSDRWPESRQPGSETDYKWAKRQQPLACCGATDDSRGGQEVESSVLNPPPPLHPSINPSPSWPPSTQADW